jgi:hypothetical protein
MIKKILFFCFASAIVLFSIINFNISPVINNLVNNNNVWSTFACDYYDDKYNNDKNKDDYLTQELKEAILDSDKNDKNRCKRRKEMVILEYISFNINLISGFTTALLGLFYLLNIGNIKGNIIGLIGIICGIIGFTLIIIYIIENILVFNDIGGDKEFIRINSNGGFLKWDDFKYVCIFYDKNNMDSIFLKYSEFGNKYLNYLKEVQFSEGEKNFKYQKYGNGCRFSSLNELGISDIKTELWEFCETLELGDDHKFKTIFKYKDEEKNEENCEEIFYIPDIQSNQKKILYERWLATLILCFFILIFNIGIILFGFFLFKESV